MILNRMLMVNITKYCNYLKHPYTKFKEPVTVQPNTTLRSLFIRCYQNSGNFTYGINKYEY